MHELSIALALLDAVRDEAREHAFSQVTVVYVKVGPLSGIVKSALESAFSIACLGSEFAGTTLRVEEPPLQIFCPACNDQRQAISPTEIVCSSCRSPAVKIFGGTALEITALEVR